jgi:hypothetical protein
VPDPRKLADAFHPSLERRWPVGRHYSKFSAEGASPARAWSDFKLAVADWYLDALLELASDGRELDHSAGVEMALEGCLASACGAFDTAVASLVAAMESGYNVGPTEEHLYLVKTYLRSNTTISIDSAKTVDSALETRHGQPIGWLAQLKRLRNLSIHRDTLSRQYPNCPGLGALLEVLGKDYIEPVEYLGDVLGRPRLLVPAILADMERM